ncbi:hypothetical protein GRI72_02775 [Altererythrobacter marinus]|uniref:HPt domain-containing protein n=1 Tax=Pelagerythrobacter marinus TaxID=538382 RepID=A0ABW9USC1_9SPHN|nr:hypothetical protein [Pelagerythrobacter marinus]MXO67756.1 hypothetical protein [Pelagerythrobacter marinus]
MAQEQVTQADREAAVAAVEANLHAIKDRFLERQCGDLDADEALEEISRLAEVSLAALSRTRHRLASTTAQAEAAEKMAEALRECLLEHGGYTIRGRCERLARVALSTWESIKENEHGR